MEIEGEPYETSDKKKRRAVYLLSVGTPEQVNAIKAIERGLHGEWDGKDPYNMMRRAEALGIELAEKEENHDGKWVRTTDPDVALTTMQTGAL